MNTHHSPTSSRYRGFTLVEVLVVIVIIGVLAAMSVQGVGFFKRKSAESRTEVFVASVSRALDEYRSDEGEYPKQGADGSEFSSDILYETLFGDFDGNDETDSDETVYLNTINPSAKGTARNVKEHKGGYVLIDGFGNPLRYRAPGDQNPGNAVDVWSAGFDGETDLSNRGDVTKDDIDNW